MNKILTLKPHMSEKAYGLSQTKDTYIFNVPNSANKLTVAGAVSAQFDVKVKSVNIALIKGKPKRTVQKGGRAFAGKRSNVKKAYVVLKKGESIPIYAAEEEEAKQEEKKAKKAAKKADKK